MAQVLSSYCSDNVAECSQQASSKRKYGDGLVADRLTYFYCVVVSCRRAVLVIDPTDVIVVRPVHVVESNLRIMFYVRALISADTAVHALNSTSGQQQLRDSGFTVLSVIAIPSTTTTATTSATPTNRGKTDDSGLSTGQLAGIIAACGITAILVIIAIALWCYR